MSEIRFSTGAGGKPLNVDGKKAQKYTLWIFVIIGLVILLFNSFAIINEGFIGVKYRFGKIVDDNMSAGLRFKIPFIEEIRPVETRNLVYQLDGDAYTRDNQTVNDLRIKVTYRYNTAYLSTLIRDIGIENVEGRFLVPYTQNISKNEIGQIRAEELVQERTVVRDRIRNNLQAALEPFGIDVTEVAIENIAFTSDFEAAIQNKVIAEQKALEAQNRTEERRHEAEQAVIAAQGRADSLLAEATAEAEAIALIQAQISQSPQYIEYLKIIQWDGILPQVIGDGVNPFVVLGANDNAPTVRNNQPSPTVNQE
ncbi:MAG: prohibitin family protein [Oscillospiraceae bacterium]|nr:prohibitin family protein [Oscillospiraceae bacterium]